MDPHHVYTRGTLSKSLLFKMQHEILTRISVSSYIMSSIADIPPIWVHALSLLVLLLHTLCIEYMQLAIKGGDEGWHDSREEEMPQ